MVFAENKTIKIAFTCDYCGQETSKRVDVKESEYFLTKPLVFCSSLCNRLHREEHDLDDIINGSIPKEYK